MLLEGAAGQSMRFDDLGPDRACSSGSSPRVHARVRGEDGGGTLGCPSAAWTS